MTSSVDRRTKVTAFILYFDTFFTASGNPVAPEKEVDVIQENDAVVAEVWPLGGRPAPQRRMSQHHKKEKSVDKSTGDATKTDVVTSFSTGPKRCDEPHLIIGIASHAFDQYPHSLETDSVLAERTFRGR